MRRVAPTVIARERLHELLDDARDREINIVSELVTAISELVVQELAGGSKPITSAAGAVMSGAVRPSVVCATAMSRIGSALRRAR
jgi:hypothetical protein